MQVSNSYQCAHEITSIRKIISTDIINIRSADSSDVPRGITIRYDYVLLTVKKITI
jgi:hypothetical protein